MSIGILGTINASASMSVVEEVLKDMNFRQNMRFSQYSKIMEQGPYKVIDKSLEQFIGIYDVEIVDYPDWFEGFYSSLVMTMVESLPEEAKKLVTDEFMANGTVEESSAKIKLETKKLLEIKEQFTQLTPKLFYEGKFSNEQKILKFCKKAYEAMNATNKDNVTSQEWYKTFEVKKPANSDGIKIVITNSSASFLAMSSVFDNKDNSSCQSLWKYHPEDSYISGLPSNLLDPNSLICYVTTGRMGDIRTFTKPLSAKHQTMIVRLMLRLVEDSDGQKYIVADRAYPHKTYTASVMGALKKICDESDGEVKLGIHSNYNSEESSSKAKLSIPHNSSYLNVTEVNSVEMISPQKVEWPDGDKKKTRGVCSRCKFKGVDEFQCDDCHLNSKVKSFGVYHDNLGNEQKATGPCKIKRRGEINVVSSTWLKEAKHD